MKNKTIYYSAEGNVLGNLWGGGQGYYPAKKYNNYKSLSKLKKDIRKDFNSKNLDSGMGYESLIGALMTIKTFTIVNMKINNKQREFKNIENKEFKLGKFDKNKFFDALGY